MRHPRHSVNRGNVTRGSVTRGNVTRGNDAWAGSVTAMVDQPMGASFEVDVSERDGVMVVSVHGAVDVVSSVRLAEVASSVAERAIGGLVIDLSGADMLSSSGLTALVRTIDHLPAGSSAVLVAPHPGVERPIVLSGLDRVIVTVKDLSAAIAAVR